MMLDNRTTQDLVNYAVNMLGEELKIPDWNPHPADPEYAFIHLFAYIVKPLLDHLSSFPEECRTKLLELFGIKPHAASVATTLLTFKPAAPLTTSITISKGTEVATSANPQEAVVFTTDRTVSLPVLKLEYCLINNRDEFFNINPLDIQFYECNFQDESTSLYLYLGFTVSLDQILLGLDFKLHDNPPEIEFTKPHKCIWEYFNSTGEWQPLNTTATGKTEGLQSDSTRDLTQSGEVVLQLSKTMATVVDSKEAHWLRCLLPIEKIKRVNGIDVSCHGILVSASNSIDVPEEKLGVSDGTPGQLFSLSQHCVGLGYGNMVQVENDDFTSWDQWKLVDSFSSSGPYDPHCQLDPVRGVIVFGPSIRTPEGLSLQYGAIPPAGHRVRVTGYLTGGGSRGNLPAGALTVLRSSLPFISDVINTVPAIGGADAEEIEHAILRAQSDFRSRERAITPSDFESLALQSSQAVARAFCPFRKNLYAKSGVVELYLLPAIYDDQLRTTPNDMVIPEQVMRQVAEYLEPRMPVTTRLELKPASLRWVTVKASLSLIAGADRQEVVLRVERLLYNFLHPLIGGNQNTGWPFGRALKLNNLFSLIQRITEIDEVDLEIYPVDPATGELGEATPSLIIPDDGVICSWKHHVYCISENKDVRY